MTKRTVKMIVTVLGVASALITISGFVSDRVNVTFLEPLQQLIPIPLWVLVALLFAMPLFLVLCATWFVRFNGSDAASLRAEVRRLKAEADTLRSGIEAERTTAAQARAALAETEELRQRVHEYESLEAELLGFMMTGRSYSLEVLMRNTRAARMDHGMNAVQSVISKLGPNVIEAGDGPVPSYRLARPGQSA